MQIPNLHIQWQKLDFKIVLIATVIFSIVSYSRNIIVAPDQNFFQVLAWQFVSWAPWAIIVPATRFYFEEKKHDLMTWVMSSVLVAFGCSIWFLLVSDIISPYLGLPQTMFGLFKWFLIFWFVISFLVFWAHLGFYLFKMVSGDLILGEVRSENNKKLAIWINGKHQIINKTDIVRIRSKDYYANIILTNGEQYWVKMRLTPLLEMIGSEAFIRVHRSSIINVDHLESITRQSENKWDALLKNGDRVRLSRRGKIDLQDQVKVIR